MKSDNVGTMESVAAAKDASNSPHRTHLYFLSFIVFLDMLGFGIVFPVMPGLIHDITGTAINESAQIGGLLLFVYAAMQFLFAPLIGGLSDRFGRRPILLITLAVLAVDYVIMALAPTLFWLVVGRIISGIMGATWAAANASVADSFSRHTRGQAFGILSGMGGAGFILGPALGGIAGEVSTRLPFFIAGALAAGGLLFGLIYLRETLPAEARREVKILRANPVSAIAQMAKVPLILPCLAVIFLINLATQAQLSIWPFWGELQFSWTSLTSGLTVSLYGILVGLAQIFATGRLINRIGVARTAQYALLLGVVSYGFLAIAQTTEMVVLAIVIGAATGVVVPALQSLMTGKIDDSSQGELQGALASTVSSSAIIGPIAMTQIFGHFTDGKGLLLPGAPYFLALILVVFAVVIVRRFIDDNKTPQ